MGSAIGVTIDFSGAKVESKEFVEKDDRKRNSLAFYITQFVEYEDDNFGPLIESVQKDRNAKHGGKPPTIRNSKFSRIGDAVLQGNAKELRNQTVVYFKTINRKYMDHHGGNTLLHMVCQEGYYTMLQFMLNPANRNDMDTNELEIEPRNSRNRTPLMLCFTPPSATFCGMRFGVGPDGNALSEKPPEVEQAIDWCKPGGPRSRENCVRLLVEHGASVHEPDYQGFTVLHFAAMWGWASTVKFLLDSGADLNAQTASGRTALMYAVQLGHLNLVLMLLARRELILEASDLEGYTALIIAVEMGEVGMEVATALLRAGADPNALTLRRKNPLKIACAAQNVAQVGLLLDFKVQRRNSAFNLLRDEALAAVTRRLEEDEARAAEEEERAAAERERLEKSGLYEASKAAGGGSRGRSAYGAWVEYIEKKTAKPFYYNTVTRKCVRNKPKDFKPNKAKLVKEAIYGLSFYH